MASSAPADKNLFINLKCNKCHAIKSENIEPWKSTLKKKKIEDISDLSGAGLEHSQEWIKNWLLKKEKKNDKKHKPKFKGTPEELEKISTWVASLKTKIDKKEVEAWLKQLKEKGGGYEYTGPEEEKEEE